MSIAGLVTALLVGVASGLFGRLVIPGRREAPIWLTVSVGVVAALAGTILARLAGVDTGTLNLLTLVIQVGLAGTGVVLVVATAKPQPSDAP
ncbi:GlsB/YeaQ/YmgE family stress response membrane protein [Micromonospora sp. DH14]|uniref:GlsB/YeaQ/YmgE family stress response membrane protein n=1 Tax=Micromonospora sp. DH14 TaxID=3040120 RepID=UPI0024430295|nr:GlsB/YeaQ/YmgE family stress response membrane protein [Micromonospora sp. DH14]MDG9673975.1 GlsB/YeaQ/YmgE family stress response membrane protein [Micromonospora sp. DH14]